MQWCKEGSDTYPQRHQLFCEQKSRVEAELKRMRQVHDMLRFKCWYYDQLLAGEDEASLINPDLGKMPQDIQQAYRNAFDRA